MKIEVWSDYVCPFCYIGKRNLEQALSQFDHHDQVEVSFKSFELDPGVQTDPRISINEALAKKYGVSVAQAKEMNDQMIQRAAQAGLAYNFDNIKQINTLHAHRLAKFAESKGKGAEMAETLLKAHFVESQFIGGEDTLVELAAKVGLDVEETRTVLRGEEFTEQVRSDEAEAAALGVQGVPFFVINRKYAISGAQPVSVFTETLEKVWQEEHASAPLQQIGSSQDALCTDEKCDI